MTAATALTPRVSTWTFDSAHTLVEFAARHMMITNVKGRIPVTEGILTFNEEQPSLSTVEVKLDASGVDTRNGQRDQHLRSADFLDAEKFPIITFRSRHIAGDASTAGSSFRITGDLTIRGVTREVTLDAVNEGRGTDPWGAERLAFSASTQFDRRDFGLTWNAALETGGILVGNDVKVTLEVQAVRT